MFWRTVLVAAFACFFLAVPDVDLLLLSLLHHRSILTHSALPAVIPFLLRRRIGLMPTAGALIGLHVHLICDALSPAVGFGQVWLPAPFKTPLGALSPLWLIVNAGFCFALAQAICRRRMPGLSGAVMVALTGGVIGVLYGLLNERSVLSAAVCLIFPGLLALAIRQRLRKAPSGA